MKPSSRSASKNLAEPRFHIFTCNWETLGKVCFPKYSPIFSGTSEASLRELQCLAPNDAFSGSEVPFRDHHQLRAESDPRHTEGHLPPIGCENEN